MQWTLLKTYRINYCQPNQEPPTDRDKNMQISPFVFVTGDHSKLSLFLPLSAAPESPRDADCLYICFARTRP